MASSLPYIEALSELAATGAPFVAVTMVETTGSTPQDAGARMLVDLTGLVHGTVGGGKIEFRAIEFAQAMLRNGHPLRTVVDWNLQRDIGMTCGGLVKLFFEVYNRSQWNIIIFGAGHVAQALVNVLMTIDCRVTCIDGRREWLQRMADHRQLTKICSDDLPQHVDSLTDQDYVLCMTMGHATDRPILAALFNANKTPAYLGVIGSKSKRGVLIRELKTDGVAADKAASFLCPIGLPIGTNEPGEIAISIAAQLLQRRDQRATKDR